MSYLDVVADVANFVILTVDEIPAWGIMLQHKLLGCCSRLLNSVIPTADEIPARGMMFAANATWML